MLGARQQNAFGVQCRALAGITKGPGEAWHSRPALAMASAPLTFRGPTPTFARPALAGRSWLEPPRDLRDESEQSFLPKKHLHTWAGHTKGVNAIRCA